MDGRFTDGRLETRRRHYWFLGAALKHFRTAAGVTQTDAAEAMGIGQSYLSSLEGGKFGSSLTHALRLLRFVGCEVVVRPREPRG